MIKITFPDGNVKEFAKGTTAYQIAESISPRLAADSLAASVNGATVDLNRAIEEDASIKFYKWDDPEGKHAFWHTSSHLLAEALEALGGRVPLLLEVKRGHNNRRLCALTLAALRTYGGPYCIESFDPTIVAWFRRNAPDILRGQLSQPPKDYGKALNKPAAAIVGNVLTNVIARPQFIAYKIGPKPLSVRLCEAMGAARAGWTSRAWTHERDYDIVIFEHYRPGAWFRADI